MSNELEFEYNLYIGKHMKEPLKFKYIDENKREWDYKLAGVNSDSINEKHEYFYFGYDLVKPLLKSLGSLTDEEWLWIANGDKSFITVVDIETHHHTIFENIHGVTHEEDTHYVTFYSEDMHCYSFNPRTGNFVLSCDGDGLEINLQQILNRIHSLHRSENEKGLLEAGLIEIVE